MNKHKLQAMADDLAQDVKAPEGFSTLSDFLTRLTIEATSKGAREEMDTLKPRDRNASCESQLNKTGLTWITGMDDQIISRYAKGMCTSDIVVAFQDMYDVEISAGLVSQVINAVMAQVVEWQSRPLDAVYPIVYFDCTVLKVRQDKRIINKAVYFVLGINLEGHKELLGIWVSENEGENFWFSVLDDLQNRGVKSVYVACVDGLKVSPYAISSIFPDTKIQLSIAHLVRNSMNLVPRKDYKKVIAGLKNIYQSITKQEASLALEHFISKWGDKYPQISKRWRAHWLNMITIFDYPTDIRKVINMAKTIESLNNVICQSVKTRKIFPSDDAVLTVVYLAIVSASEKWAIPIRH